MKQTTGSPPLYLASSVTEQTLLANSDQRLHAIAATLEECRAALIASSNLETAQLVGLAILQLRMKLNRIGDAELKALCDAITPDDHEAETSLDPESPRPSVLLKLVK
jgi:hypothetical protein